MASSHYHYKQPSSDELKHFYEEIKKNAEIPAPTKSIFLLVVDSLRKSKTPAIADQLFVAFLIWLNTEKEPILLDKQLLAKGLGLTSRNQIDYKLQVEYLVALALHAHTTDMKVTHSESKKETKNPASYSNPMKDQFALSALAILEKIPLKKIPTELIEAFKMIPFRRKIYPTSVWRQAKNFASYYVANYSEERSKQIYFIQTASKIIETLVRDEEPFDFKSIIMGMVYYLMYDLENECRTTRQPGAILYTFLAGLAKIKHSSEVPFEKQKFYFDTLYRFIERITIQQWKESRPKGAEAFNIKAYVDKIYETIPTLNLSAHPPRSFFSSAIYGAVSVVPTALSYAKDFALLTFANELYVVAGIGKNSIIIRLAHEAGEYLASYAGPIGSYFIKQSAIAIGEAAEKKAMTTSITGMLRATIGYLSTKELTEDDAASIYHPKSDPFEALVNLAVVYAKKEESLQKDVSFFESLVSLYKILPPAIKASLNESVQKKRAAEAKLATEKTISAESKEEKKESKEEKKEPLKEKEKQKEKDEKKGASVVPLSAIKALRADTPVPLKATSPTPV